MLFKLTTVLLFSLNVPRFLELSLNLIYITDMKLIYGASAIRHYNGIANLHEGDWSICDLCINGPYLRPIPSPNADA